jgi:hypothetical protein
MAAKNRAEAITEAVNRLIEGENEIGGARPARYARTVYLAFEEIGRLLEMRVRLTEICESFESSGLLPENANAHSFRDAYRREKARRDKTRARPAKPLLRADKPGADAEAQPAGSLEGAEQKSSDADEEKERLKNIIGTVVDTGNGVIRKLPNGTFDF